MPTVLYEKQSRHIAVITLNRPEALNAFTADMRAALFDAFASGNKDEDVRAIVVTGAGRAFSAGADIKEMTGRNVEDQLNGEYAAFLNAMQASAKPIIAAINGPAAGIGMTTALTSDLRVMAEDAYLCSVFSNIGLVPDGGLSWLLVQQVGYARAYQLAIEAERITATKAEALGLINRIVPPGQALENALQWAEEIATRAPIAMTLTKRALRAAAEQGLKNTMAMEAMFQRTAIATEDCAEGVAAVLQKRKPEFKGR